MVNSFKKEVFNLKNFFKDKYNFISFAVALVPSMLLWIFQPSDTVPYWLFSISLLLCMCFLWLALMAIFHYLDEKGHGGLSIICCEDNIILCRENTDISVNIIVTIYELRNNYERVLGYGYIQNIQQNGIIQIAILDSSVFDTPEELINHISANTGNIIIKTVATTNTISSLVHGGNSNV